ncbi:hypothetical protein AWH56_005575 [Anaerobacillus isosaccharinicus]|uniref:Uncharacterized protein n=1 Tax=Anaerobacillus isosaccharinicus TaxID=1532552 RepID=A0A7S7L9X1_9BACI|nr:hypothetical protein [Anaerobacillus isosaccharinicus]MBA5584504.1 hypothetical protein [Anaerobacillus isosaccharinicus]QOY37112.1 hypothetical protein AWH56_005575 [Anaerobacillus isosaccharinicus]
MLDQLNQERLLSILKEVRKLGDSNNSLSSSELVKEIEKMLIVSEEA